jgi:hypothetical protein
MINSLLLAVTTFFALDISANPALVEENSTGNYQVCKLDEPVLFPVATCVIEDLTLSFDEKVEYCMYKLRPSKKQPYIH